MKKLTLPLFVLAFLFSASVQAQQHTLLTKQTADWCPRCGSWGWTFTKQALEELKDEDVVFWAMHFSGGLMTPTSNTVANNFNLGYQPVFFLNQDDLNVNSSNISAKIVEAKETIQLLNSFPSIVEFDLVPTLDANSNLHVSAKVKFKESTEADYNFALYLIRDKVVAYQASVGQNAVHPYLLDKSFFDTAWGPLVNNGDAIGANDEFEYEATLSGVNLHSGEVSDLKVAAVLWYKVGDEYTFINGKTEDTQITNDADDVLVFPFNYRMEPGRIILEVGKNQQIHRAELFSTTGQRMPAVVSGLDSESITLSYTDIPAGVYTLSVGHGSKSSAVQLYLMH